MEMDYLIKVMDELQAKIVLISEQIEKAESGSDEEIKLLNALRLLSEQQANCVKQIQEANAQNDTLELENKKHESDMKQHKIENTLQAVGMGLTATGVVVGVAELVQRAKAFDIVMKFEEKGRICSTLGKSLTGGLFKGGFKLMKH